VTLPPFTLHRPQTFEEAAEVLDRYGDDAVVYCGGTELFLVMKLGLAAFAHLVDLKRIPELDTLEQRNGELRVGAGVTHRQLEHSPLVHSLIPALAEMEGSVANLRVRNAGTLGGNLCFSDPHSDPATFLLASGAVLVCRLGAASRTVPIGEFVRGPYETALRHGELLAEIRIQELPRGAGLAHMKFAVHERPALTVACFVRAEEGSIVDGRIAVGSVSAAPARLPQAERMLVGLRADPDDRSLEEVADAAGTEVSPFADGNGSVEYKRQLVRVFVRRCCTQALVRARLASGNA
jgi:carbon-monoxide dehydrogenase medium subunit